MHIGCSHWFFKIIEKKTLNHCQIVGKNSVFVPCLRHKMINPSGFYTLSLLQKTHTRVAHTHIHAYTSIEKDKISINLHISLSLFLFSDYIRIVLQLNAVVTLM